MGRLIFWILVVILGLFFGVQIFWHLLGVMTVVAWGAAITVFVGGMLYCLYLVLRSGLLSDDPAKPKGKARFKVWSTKTNNVFIFREQPTIRDLALLSDELHLTKLELAGDVFSVDNDTQVIVLEDDGKEAVKVKVKSAKKKDRDAIGWVCRSSLIRDESTQR